MKQKIKIKLLDKQCVPSLSENGDWIDLRAAENITLSSPWAATKPKKGKEESRIVRFSTKYIPLGIAVELPDGMEAIVALRSSSPKKFNIMCSNSIGIIDNGYRGDNDQWYLPAIAKGDVNINKGDRICQFKIQLSQKATVWQKLKWLFSDGIELEIVENLNNPDRGGLGHSGVK